MHNEEDAVKYFRKLFPSSSNNILRWGGDDAAYIKGNPEQVSALDLIIEDVHFKQEYSSFYEIGYKSVSVNLSDIAACGALPKYIMIGLAANKEFFDNNIEEFYSGLKSCLDEWDVEFAGGDLSASEKIYISVSVHGELLPGSNFWSRSGAKVGDYIYVTGVPGLSGLGLEILKGNEKSYPGAVEKHKCPKPPIKQSMYLINNQIKVSSCCDISDGLSTELNHLSEESKCRFEIELSSIPVPDVSNGLKYAMNAGEDYELVFTSSDCIEPDVFYRATGIGLASIGKVKEGSGVFSDNKRIISEGYSHYER